MDLLGHIIRRSAAKLRSHSCHWEGLEEKTVPSAEVTDEQTAKWSRQMYERDLEQEPHPRTGETPEPPVTIPCSDDEHRYTPEDIDAIKYGRAFLNTAPRRTLGLIAFGAMLAASLLTAARAEASPVDEYIIRNADRVCETLAVFPSFDGVTGVMEAVMDEGHFTIQEAAKVVVLSVNADCPWHMQLLRDFAATSKVTRT